MKYTYFETAVVAVVKSLKKEFKNFAYVANFERYQDFPIYIQTTGDNTYMTVNSDRLEAKPKDEKVLFPCMVLHYRGVTINEDNKTNDVTDGKFVVEINGFKQEIVHEMSTYDVTLRMESTILFSDIFQYLAFIEYTMNDIYKQRPFKFEYWGKEQQGTWQLDTVDHDSEYDETGLYGEAEVAPQQELLSFYVNLNYPSFQLNKYLKAAVDGDGDGSNEGGIDPTGLTPADLVIKGVISHIDDSVITNKISSRTHGEVPDHRKP